MPMHARKKPPAKKTIKSPRKKKVRERQVLPRGPQVGFISPRRAAQKKADLRGVMDDMSAPNSEEDEDLPPWDPADDGE